MAEIEAAHAEPAKSSGGMLKMVGSIATITVAVFYGVGLLVTNAYLLSIGVNDFNLLRARCVLTGTWATLLILCVALPGAGYYRMLSREGSKLKKHHFLFVGALVFLCYMIFRIICGTVGIAVKQEVEALYVIGTLGFLFVPVFSLILNRIKERREPSSFWAGWFVLALLLIFAAVDIG